MISILAMGVVVVYLLADRWLSLSAPERAERRAQVARVFGGGMPRTDP